MDASSLGGGAMRQDHLQWLLKQYEITSRNSLGGPATTLQMVNGIVNHQNVLNPLDADCKPLSAVSSALANFVLHRDQAHDLPVNSASFFHTASSLNQAMPTQSFPILMQADRTVVIEKQETMLEGECIACFAVGGEKRLCLPQILNTVLRNFSVVDLNRARNDLNIHCSECTLEQLNCLKMATVLSSSATSCSLITKTDAERLCNYLLRQRQDVEKQQSRHRRSINGHTNGTSEAGMHSMASSSQHVSSTLNDDGSIIPVLHMCFGRCRGRYHSKLYASPSAECIECDDCGEFFAPDRFVIHSHRNQERHTCHWGFDSANWRSYIHTSDQNEENKKILDEMKLRFDVTGLTKRRFDEHVTDTITNDIKDKKRIKLETDDHQTTAPIMEKSAINLATPSAFGTLDQQSTLPYLFCDPLFLVAYYQTLLSAAAGQQATSMAPVFTPSFLPPVPQLTNGSSCGIEAKHLETSLVKIDCTPSLHGKERQLQPQAFYQQMPNVNSGNTLDESTTAAALKLLQLRGAANDKRNECVGNGFLYSTPKKNAHAFGMDDMKKLAGDNSPMDSIDNVTNGHQVQSPINHHPFFTASKEPFKKQLLHLFTVEQQQKQAVEMEQKQHQMDSGRASVEVIVDDDENIGCNQRQIITESHEATSSTESEKCENGRMSIETQMADEQTNGCSDEGINQTLDDILRRYVNDQEGLMIVKSKIAENQRFLEQKLMALVSENRALREECVQLRLKQHELHAQQHKAGLNFLGLIPKPVAL